MPQYNGVWTLEQQAQALTNQQWVTDPNFKNTTLLLQADGTGSGSQNQTFLDGSTNNFFITRNGNTTQGSFSPFSQAPGYWGNYFGASSFIQSSVNSVMAFASNPYTVEFWIYLPALPAAAAYVYSNTQTAGAPQTYISTTGQVICQYQGSSAFATTTATLPIGVWNHVAIVRTSTGASGGAIYFNGASVLTYTDATNVSYTAASAIIGNGGTNNYLANAYISNFRVCKGTAVYTANFTPSTAPLTTTSQGAANCSLLTCQSNRFLDNSTNAATFTVTGTPSVQAFGPFAPALQWTPDVVGGSGYFDGTGDYLTSTITAINNTTMTMECWVYNVALDNTNGNHYVQVDNGANTNYLLSHNINGVARFLSRNDSGSAIFDLVSANGIMKTGQWQHMVGVRTASNASLYVDGVRVATVASPSVSSISGTSLYISSNAGSLRIINGYLSSARIVSGTAVYDPSLTTLTVPTAPLTAITNTKLLLNFTNAGIYDGKMANNLETVGNAQVATSPVKYGSGSMYFNGSTSYLTRPYSPLFALGSGNFTVECWINTTQNGGANYPSVVGRWAAGASWDLRHSAGDNSGKPTFAYNDGTSNFNVLSTGGTVYDGQWHHLAAVRNNNIITLYVDGVSVGTSTFTGTIAAATSTPLTVGSTSGGGVYYIGYIDDLRITVGVARYFANFTPPQQALPRQ